MPTLIIWWDYLPHDIDPCVPQEKNLAAALLEIDVEGNFQVDPNVNSIAEPALSAVTPANPVTGPGVVVLPSVVVLLPSWPAEFAPKQLTVPFARRAQECESPHAIPTAVVTLRRHRSAGCCS